MNLKYPIIGVIAIIAIGIVVLSTVGSSVDPISIQDDSKLEGEVTIGILLPLTGDLATHGNENNAGAKFGVDEFNKHLEELGESWHLKAISEDSATNPVIALDKLTSLNAKGVGIVIGPETSSNTRNVKGYSDANNMLLVSCCSSAPALAIPNDSVFRLVPDDSNQGTALAKLMHHEGIEVMVPVWRGDTWGDGLSEATSKSFEERGGIVDGEGIRYNPESPEFSTSTSLLASNVQKHVDQYGADKVGIMFLSFGEVLQFMQSASSHDVLDKVRWFGPGATAKEQKLINDEIGLEFSNSVQFTTVSFAVSKSPLSDKVEKHLLDTFGTSPSTFVQSSYDAAWLIGLSILETQSTDVSIIKAKFPEIAENYVGAIGSTKLNAAGDLAQGNYEVWGIRGAEWVQLGQYTHADDSISLSSMDSSIDSISTQGDSKLEGEVTIGALLPLTGDLATHGNENNVGTKFGVDEFNKHLEELGESWHLKVISEDTASNPVTALDKLTSLYAKGIDIVIGPESSSNVRNVKGYSDANNMLLVSCCSTAPTLAIPNDSVFRLVPDDRNQGVALAKLMYHEGIEVMVPVWRGDTWGDGLSETASKSFEERGGIVDGEGIRYNPESPEFSTSTSLLASNVQKHVDQYGADKVGIMFLSFGEVLQFMQSASTHDVLDTVRWFGPGATAKEKKLINDEIGLEFSNSVQFTAVSFAVSDNPISDKVEKHLLDTFGTNPSTFVQSSYDAAWLIGLSMLETQSTDVSIIKAKFPEVAEDYVGAIGSTKLNPAGDLAQGNYEVWGIRGVEWVQLGQYTHADDSILLN